MGDTGLEPRRTGQRAARGRGFNIPVYEASDVTASTTSGSIIAWLADWNDAYAVVDHVAGGQMVYLPAVTGTSGGRPTGQVGWHYFARIGGAALDSGAARFLKT